MTSVEVSGDGAKEVAALAHSGDGVGGVLRDRAMARVAGKLALEPVGLDGDHLRFGSVHSGSAAAYKDSKKESVSHAPSLMLCSRFSQEERVSSG